MDERLGSYLPLVYTKSRNPLSHNLSTRIYLVTARVSFFNMAQLSYVHLSLDPYCVHYCTAIE